MNRFMDTWIKARRLAIIGGLAFWLTNLAISLTPIAAEYRAAMSISYYPMLVEALVGGMLIGLLVSFPFVGLSDRLLARNPVWRSVLLSTLALVIVTVLIGNPASFAGTENVLRYFLIGTTFNLLRFLALGIAIGYLYKKLHPDHPQAHGLQK